MHYLYYFQGASVSGDGSWQHRGFTSKTGLVSLIGPESNKVVDVEVKSTYCVKCQKQKEKYSHSPDQFALWFEDHKDECRMNHNGSSGAAMEVAAVKDMFLRSIDKLGTRQ